jgi:hypothetical protein
MQVKAEALERTDGGMFSFSQSKGDNRNGQNMLLYWDKKHYQKALYIANQTLLTSKIRPRRTEQLKD